MRRESARHIFEPPVDTSFLIRHYLSASAFRDLSYLLFLRAGFMCPARLCARTRVHLCVGMAYVIYAI